MSLLELLEGIAGKAILTKRARAYIIRIVPLLFPSLRKCEKDVLMKVLKAMKATVDFVFYWCAVKLDALLWTKEEQNNIGKDRFIQGRNKTRIAQRATLKQKREAVAAALGGN